MSWWSNLFGKKEQKEAEKAPSAPTYEELLRQLEEREDEVKKQRAAMAGIRSKLLKKIHEDGATIQRYADALQFYATHRHWKEAPDKLPAKVAQDGGLRARKALNRA